MGFGAQGGGFWLLGFAHPLDAVPGLGLGILEKNYIGTAAESNCYSMSSNLSITLPSKPILNPTLNLSAFQARPIRGLASSRFSASICNLLGFLISGVRGFEMES